jgi:RNA polymerase sigma-70 factor (ECF subfamily)
MLFDSRLGEPTLKVEGGLKAGRTAERDETTELFARHASSVYRYCLRRLGSPEEAEDALQVTYLNAWRSLETGCKPKEERAWLFQIAANVCASAIRSKLRGTRLELCDPDALDRLAAVENPESDDLLDLTEALRELPVRQRRALVLRDWQGLSYNEIAAEMAVSGAAVETLLFRARNKVAATLTSPEWRGRLAPSARALLVWPFSFLRTKSVATTSAGHLKTGLVLAGGTVAPLVAFGLLQLTLLDPAETEASRGPAVAQETRPEAPASWLGQGRLPHASPTRAERPEKPLDRRDRPRRHTSRSSSAKSHSTGEIASARAASAAPKIVLCHGTHSETKPGVTISVSTHALRGLSEDAQRACN